MVGLDVAWAVDLVVDLVRLFARFDILVLRIKGNVCVFDVEVRVCSKRDAGLATRAWRGAVGSIPSCKLTSLSSSAIKSSSLDCGLLKSSSESMEGEAVVRGVAGRACLVRRVEAVSGRLLGRVEATSVSMALRFLEAEGVVGGQGAESAEMTESAARWTKGGSGEESDGQQASGRSLDCNRIVDSKSLELLVAEDLKDRCVPCCSAC